MFDTKKLLAFDMDNALWGGIIGEIVSRNDKEKALEGLSPGDGSKNNR